MADQFSILAFQHRLLQQKYGRSGAGKLPDSEALTAGEVLCLNFWGIEASGCKYLTSFFFFLIPTLSMIMNVFLIQIHLFTPDYVEKKYCPIILLLKARTQEPCKAIAQCFNLSIPTWETNLN